MTDTESASSPALSRVHKVLIGLVAAGAVVIAGIGFAGSYAAVQELAVKKGFGDFSYWFPIGIDAGIVVLLALDLLLTWIRIPFPLLRQTAWLLTAATIAFNGAAAWPDPLGVGMHAVIPVLFVVAVEAARHAVGRIADITADKHMEGVRITRWLLSPLPTFRLWRRMKLWEVRSYERAVKLEQDRLIYQARLHARFGRGWRRKAPVEALMPLRLARYGVPLRETAPAGLEAAGIRVPAELERIDRDEVREELPAAAVEASPPELESAPVDVDPSENLGQDEVLDRVETAGHPSPADHQAAYAGGYDLHDVPRQAGAPVPVAARNGRRPHMVQARVDAPEWVGLDSQRPLADEAAAVQSPMAESQGGPDPELPVHETTDEALHEDEAPAVPEGLAGTELLEFLYLQLPLDQRSLSASKLAELLHGPAGFTAGTARKYLGEIKRKHG